MTSRNSAATRLGVLLICSMSLFIVGLDITAVNVALPSIGEQLHAELSWLQWTVSAYTVVMASLLLFAGSMADRFGRKRTLDLGPQRLLSPPCCAASRPASSCSWPPACFRASAHRC